VREGKLNSRSQVTGRVRSRAGPCRRAGDLVPPGRNAAVTKLWAPPPPRRPRWPRPPAAVAGLWRARASNAGCGAYPPAAGLAAGCFEALSAPIREGRSPSGWPSSGMGGDFAPGPILGGPASNACPGAAPCACVFVAEEAALQKSRGRAPTWARNSGKDGGGGLLEFDPAVAPRVQDAREAQGGAAAQPRCSIKPGPWTRSARGHGRMAVYSGAGIVRRPSDGQRHFPAGRLKGASIAGDSVATVPPPKTPPKAVCWCGCPAANIGIAAGLSPPVRPAWGASNSRGCAGSGPTQDAACLNIGRKESCKGK